MAIEPSRVAAVFDDWARRGRAEGMERGHAHAARAGFERLGVKSNSRYLDIGCGNGYSVRWAASVGPDVEALGIDISREMIERASEQSAALTNARFIESAFPSDIAELAPSSFDAIFSMEVFYYLPDLGGAVAEVARLLRPGGRFVCIVDHYKENVESHSWGPDLGLELHLESAAEWSQLFTDAGFSAVEQHRARAASVEGEPDTWKQIEGSLMTLGTR